MTCQLLILSFVIVPMGGREVTCYSPDRCMSTSLTSPPLRSTGTFSRKTTVALLDPSWEGVGRTEMAPSL